MAFGLSSVVEETLVYSEAPLGPVAVEELVQSSELELPVEPGQGMEGRVIAAGFAAASKHFAGLDSVSVAQIYRSASDQLDSLRPSAASNCD